MLDVRKERLLRHLESLGLDLSGVSDATPLISTGRIDSLGLFGLITWMEGELGRTLDPGEVPLGGEIDSLADIVGWVDRRDSA